MTRLEALSSSAAVMLHAAVWSVAEVAMVGLFWVATNVERSEF